MITSLTKFRRHYTDNTRLNWATTHEQFSLSISHCQKRRRNHLQSPFLHFVKLKKKNEGSHTFRGNKSHGTMAVRWFNYKLLSSFEIARGEEMILSQRSFNSRHRIKRVHWTWFDLLHSHHSKYRCSRDNDDALSFFGHLISLVIANSM